MTCVRTTRLGFLGPRLFRFENPDFRGCISLGFPWILSSESRLINGLRWIFAEKFFVAFLPLGAFEAMERKAAGEAMRKRRRVHRASLTRILIFCNRLSPRSFSQPASHLHPEWTTASSAAVRLAKMGLVRGRTMTGAGKKLSSCLSVYLVCLSMSV
jgi:hypothetical protein